jgi:Zn-dependent protease
MPVSLVELLGSLALKLPALLIAVTTHEVAHAVVADRLGDPTARRAGRITLNPLPHIDPIGAIAFVLAGFGWARPVPVVAANLARPRRDMVLIAVAGPAANFVVAFLALVSVAAARAVLGAARVTGTPVEMALVVFEFNLALGIFNILPVPPLDGGHLLTSFAPGPWARLLEQYGTVVLLLAVVSGATRYVVGPIFEAAIRGYLAVVRLIF